MAAATNITGSVDALAGREILVVDDSRTTLAMIGRRLEKIGCIAAQSIDGVDALALLEQREFDLVLLDMVMPRLSGVRTLRQMRGSLRHADTPVIMMTSRSDPAAAVEALEAGADDHVAKPIDFPVLAARMKRLLRRAALVSSLRRASISLDARAADRASELGELRAELAAVHADRSRMSEALAQLRGEIVRLSA